MAIQMFRHFFFLYRVEDKHIFKLTHVLTWQTLTKQIFSLK